MSAEHRRMDALNSPANITIISHFACDYHKYTSVKANEAWHRHTGCSRTSFMQQPTPLGQAFIIFLMAKRS